MSRTLFSRGLRGATASRIQRDLLRQGFSSGPVDKFIDGTFGGFTEAALQSLQADRQLNVTGAVDTDTWPELTSDPVPGLFERCLDLTADFEGHGFELLQGNFDGAGLTWGVIGFTLASREIQQLLAEAEAMSPGILDRNLGPLANDWRVIVQQPMKKQLAFADKLSEGAAKASVKHEWKVAFAALGREPVIQRLQMKRAHEGFFVPAQRAAQRLNLVTELGVALAFDVHVQNGGFKSEAFALAASLGDSVSEFELRERLADSVADSGRPGFREDVRARKQTLASGHGVVHGGRYELRAWGLDEFLAN